MKIKEMTAPVERTYIIELTRSELVELKTAMGTARGGYPLFKKLAEAVQN